MASTGMIEARVAGRGAAGTSLNTRKTISCQEQRIRNGCLSKPRFLSLRPDKRSGSDDTHQAGSLSSVPRLKERESIGAGFQAACPEADLETRSRSGL